VLEPNPPPLVKLEGFSLVTPVTGLKRPNTGKEDDDDDDDVDVSFPRSRAMKLLSLDHLCNLLKYAVSRMKMHSGVSVIVHFFACPMSVRFVYWEQSTVKISV
jgi:hypothetical protein